MVLLPFMYLTPSMGKDSVVTSAGGQGGIVGDYTLMYQDSRKVAESTRYQTLREKTFFNRPM